MFSLRDFLPERSEGGERASFRNLDLNNTSQLKAICLGSLLVLSGAALRRSLIGLAMVIGGGSVLHRALKGTEEAEQVGLPGKGPVHRHRLSQSIRIRRPVDEVYRFIRNVENTPRYIKSIETVQVLDDKRSFWIARTLIGDTTEWYLEIANDRPGELIEWHTLPGGDVQHSGSIHFEDSENGTATILKVSLTFIVRHTEFADDVARILNESPDEQMLGDLGRLKFLLEAGPQTLRVDQPESAESAV